MPVPVRGPVPVLGLGLALLIGGGISASSAAAQDPFQPGLRWTMPADPNQPSIPRAVTFAAEDALAWTASNAAHPGFAVAVAVESATTVQPLFRDLGIAGASGSLSVASPRTGEALFALVQLPAPDAQHRATEVRRYSASSAAAGAAFAPFWTYDAGVVVNAPAFLACDASGGQVILAVRRDATSQVLVDRLDAASGARLMRATVSGANLSAMALSDDAPRVALSAGLDLWVLDTTSGAVLHHEALASSTSALALSGDGLRLVIGGHAIVRVLESSSAGYATAFTIQGASQELPARAALSRDGRTLAIGWWNAVLGVDLRFEVWDVATRTRLLNHVQTGIAGGPQNFPEIVRTTNDGRRAALGCWGDGTTKPEIVLYDRDVNAIVLAVDLPGSVFALDLDAQGSRVVVGMKSAHANQFASSGEFRLYDTGERDLVLQASPLAGGAFDLAAKKTGAGLCIFLDGDRSPTPFSIPGVAGALYLNRMGLSVTRTPCDANGRADVSLPIPGSATQIGTFRHFQAVFRVGGVLVFGSSVVDALVL